MTMWHPEKDRRHPLKSLAWAPIAFPRYRKKRDIATQFYLNGNIHSTSIPDISIIQAARDGLLDVVLAHLRRGLSHIYDVDEVGYTALHHATRYNRVNVLEALLNAGADVNVRGAQDETTPLHMACRYNSGSVTQLLLTQGAEVNARDIKGKTPLHYATRRGNDVPTKMLLSVSSCDVNMSDNDHTTPLIMAAMQGNPDMCEILLSRGAKLAQADINDMTPLMWTAAEGHVAVVELLLRAALRHGEPYQRQYIEAQDNEGSTALLMAVQNGSLEVCKLLLNHFADVNCYKNNLTTPLHMAASNGYLDMSKLLIFRGANVNRKDMEQMTPIHKAALYNKVDVIKLLVEYGADMNAKDKKHMSPLHCASWKGQKDAVQYLLENGAQVAESDSSLKTALHWTVQFGHYDTLAVLLAHGGTNTNMLEATDKNDQTVLHYAAYIGNVAVMRMLLESGARPDAKDQEERTSLHISAEYNNMSCVETLVEFSSRETNDDDVDGNTPLLAACLHGHNQVVQLLLSLSADVSKTDDEHRTALMLAATRGHTSVMKILLDNQASLNDVDKMKNTALHYACTGGHIEAVQLLLDRRADVTVKNTRDQTPLDLAIDNLHSEVTMTMLLHKSWRDMLNVRDKNGLTALDRLIEKLPESAMVVLDHCVERSSRDDDDPTLSLVFDYQYIDPGPEDPACGKKRYYALNTMVEHHRDTLLSHPLCQSLLSQKWVRFGRITFTCNLLIYLGYLLSLSFYVLNVGQTINVTIIDDVYRCPIFLNNLDQNNTTLVELLKKKGQMSPEDRKIKDSTVWVVSCILVIFVVIFLVREVTKLIHQRLRYLFNFFNLIPWVMMIATIIFIWPFQKPCLPQWRGAWIALFLAWINFIMYLRRIDFVGIYVIMFVAVLTSLLKAVFMFLLFICAFTGSFYIVLSTKPVFRDLWSAMLNIFVMTLGEIQYSDEYGEKVVNEPFATDINFLLLVFLFLMPIVLMNLMIGIAVGDIEKIQHNAYLKRIALQVELLYMLESSMPKFLQKKAYVRRVTIKPNDGGQTDCFQQLWRKLLGSSRNVQFIEAERKDHVTGTLDKLREQMSQQQQRIRLMQVCIQQQASLLQKIASKLDVNGTDEPMVEPPGIVYPHSDVGSIYDGLESGSQLGVVSSPAPIGIEQMRQKSIRISAERPRSIII